MRFVTAAVAALSFVLLSGAQPSSAQRLSSTRGVSTTVAAKVISRPAHSTRSLNACRQGPAMVASATAIRSIVR
jgi:hypothetical protein